MTFPRHHRCWLFAAVLLALMSGCGPAVHSSATRDDTRRTYQDGKRVVEVHVMLDRLFLVRKGGANQIQRTEVYLLRTAVASLAHLEQVAQQMRAAQPDISEISAYVRQADQPSAEPQRVTPFLAVRCPATTDLDAIAKPYRLTLVKQLDYSPDTRLMRVEGDGLVAALDVAEVLRRNSNVVFAIPQLEHLATLRSAGPTAPDRQR